MYDSILFWNDVALEANRISHTDDDKEEQNGPTLSSRALAIVHLAMHDARVRIQSTPYSQYLPWLEPPPRGASAQAAVAGAAHATLSALFPSQRNFFDAKLTEAGNALDLGHDYGRYVAREILHDRKDDPDADDDGYVPSLSREHHRVDPENPEQGFHGPFYGRSRGFAIKDRHQIDPPPSGAQYERALKEVRGKGIAPELSGTLLPHFPKRTTDETLSGLFWAYDGTAGIGTPPRLYNQIVRRIAMYCQNKEHDNARLFALVNVAMADAGILAWEEKYRYDLWRPVLGIREHDDSMGLATTAWNPISEDTDTGWLPLGAPATNSIKLKLGQSTVGTFPYNQAILGRLKNFTPPFPAYPSGHATFGAAAFHITRLFYRVPFGHRSADQLFHELSFVSDELNGVNQDSRGTIRPRHLRSFPNGLWQMIEENGRSRVYLGVHWIFDAFAVNDRDEMDLSRNIGGVPLGLRIAEDIYNNGMKRTETYPKHGATPENRPTEPADRVEPDRSNNQKITSR